MKNIVLSLFDESGNMVRPWAEAGWDCYCVDLENDLKAELVGLGRIFYLNHDLTRSAAIEALVDLKPSIIFGFPPCTDLAVSGAMHFENKRKKNPNFQAEAVALAKVVPDIADKVECPWFLENPVSVLSTMYRKPDFSFHPYQYGGYLPEDDKHPRWPDYIAPRDHYRKKTCLWTGNGFIMPEKRSLGDPKEDSKQHRKLGGKSKKTKQIRSETPRGFAEAVFQANGDKLWKVPTKP